MSADAAAPTPVSLRISVTDRCQLRCSYCMPPGGVADCGHGDVLRFEEIVRFVRAVRDGFGLGKVHLTGGEPLVRRGIVDLVAMLTAEGVADLALTTNGIALAALAGSLQKAGLGRVNLSLDTLDARTFEQLTGGGRLADVLDGIAAAQRVGLGPVKINTVVLRGVNDGEVVAIAQWALGQGCAIRFLELMPIGPARAFFVEAFAPAAEVRARIEESFTLTPLPHRAGASSRDFRAMDASGRRGVIGFITADSEPFCGECRRLRLTSTGRLIACLARGGGVDVRALLQTPGADADRRLRELVGAELRAKCRRAGFDTEHTMSRVGG